MSGFEMLTDTYSIPSKSKWTTFFWLIYHNTAERNTVVFNLLVSVCANGLYGLFMFLSSCFGSVTRPKTWTAVDLGLCCICQMYADLKHYVEIDSLAVILHFLTESYPASCYSVKCSTFHGSSRYPAPLQYASSLLRMDPSGGGDSLYIPVCA